MNATTSSTRMEIVVARFEEDLRWLRRVPRDVRTVVYDKSGAAQPGHLPLPNRGREAHTYLHHITRHYDELADLTVFVQGRPFDHAPDLHRRLRAIASGSETVEDFCWFGFLVDWDDAFGSRLFQTWSKNPAARPLDLRGFWSTLFGRAPMPEHVVFFGGGQFAVTRACVHRQPRAFYEKALHTAEVFPDAAHCFERVWDRVFSVNGIPAELRGHTLPIYLKPIRRLHPPICVGK